MAISLRSNSTPHTPLPTFVSQRTVPVQIEEFDVAVVVAGEDVSLVVVVGVAEGDDQHGRDALSSFKRRDGRALLSDVPHADGMRRQAAGDELGGAVAFGPAAAAVDGVDDGGAP